MIRGVVNGPSPDWLQRRLKAVGQRPISALVDMTNYIMLSYGRPLHVYDLAKLDGAIRARRARDGEEVLALNGKTYRLDPTMTVIADDAEVHDIGGIMGGEHSGVTEATTDILIECAYFTPEHIALTGQKLGLVSDARSRFERGVDPAFVEPGLELATAMAIELAGGEPSQIVRAGHAAGARQACRLSIRRAAQRLAGIDVPEDRQAAILQRLGFTVTRDDVWRVAVPSWRRDVDGAADLVEEIVRIEGMDKVPSTPLAARAGRGPADRDRRPADRAQGAAHRRRARPQRGGDLELHLRGRGRGVRRLGLDPRQSDQRGDEGDAALAPARPARRRGAQRRARRRKHRLVRDRAALSGGQRAADPGPRSGRGRAGRATGAAKAATSMRSTPRRRRWRSSPPPARRSTISRCSARRPASTIPASPGGSASGRRRCWPNSARSTRASPRRSTSTGRWSPPRSSSTPSRPGAAAPGTGAAPIAPPPLQAVTRDFAFLVPADLAADRLLRAVRGADKASDRGARACSTVFTGAGVPEGQKSLAVEVVLQPSREELHRRGAEGDLRADHRRRGEAGRDAQGLTWRRKARSGLRSRSRPFGAAGSARRSPRASARPWASGSTGAARSDGARWTGRATRALWPTRWR